MRIHFGSVITGMAGLLFLSVGVGVMLGSWVAWLIGTGFSFLILSYVISAAEFYD